VYILSCIFLENEGEYRRLLTEGWPAFHEFWLLLISSRLQFWFVWAVTKHLYFATILNYLSPIFILLKLQGHIRMY
jgi:hypothetical protein